MAEKMADHEGAQFYLPPPKLSKWEGFKQFMWNSDRGEFMGRTGTSWGKVGLFYVIFYAGLAAFFSIMLVVFYQTLDNYEPKWQLERSVIGTNPGMGFRPMPPESNIESTLIWFDHGQNRTMNHWIQNLNTFLTPYRQKDTPGDFKNCETEVPEQGQVCLFDVEGPKMKDCTPAQYFGYDKGKPCVAIKLNRIYGWKPEYITPTNLPDVAENIPDTLKTTIQAYNEKHDMVWLYCEGENPADKENAGPIEYYPHQGFKSYYFPYLNQRGYLSPLVMIYFSEPKRGVLINVECRAYVKGIVHNRMERRGSVHFELMID